MNHLQFEPKQWHSCDGHDWQTCTQGVNCYSYALNRPDYYWSVPGLGFAHTETRKYVDSFNTYFRNVFLPDFQNKITQGALMDGLVQTTEPVAVEGYYLAALFFPEHNHNFHWYRRDDDGTWSHKDGWKLASNQDESGSIINDPRSSAANSAYPIFAGFFLVPRNRVALVSNFPLQ